VISVDPKRVYVTSKDQSPHEVVAVCCSVLQCVAVCCSVLQCVAVCCSACLCHVEGSVSA